ncbi:hypothetical protein ACHQM5_025540 [Ranunculus cassubicifolius]
MALPTLLILLAIFRTVSSAPPPELSQAISDMTTKSYYGFAILLGMLNDTTRSSLGQGATFFMPDNQHLAESPISRDHLEEFILSHAIPDPLVFSELAHLPTGTLFPSYMNGRLLRISGIGRHTFVNNAQITSPNVCSGSLIKCHGIDAVIANRDNQMDPSRSDNP